MCPFKGSPIVGKTASIHFSLMQPKCCLLRTFMRAYNAALALHLIHSTLHGHVEFGGMQRPPKAWGTKKPHQG
jgi:hypothetical protein